MYKSLFTDHFPNQSLQVVHVAPLILLLIRSQQIVILSVTMRVAYLQDPKHGEHINRCLHL